MHSRAPILVSLHWAGTDHLANNSPPGKADHSLRRLPRGRCGEATAGGPIGAPTMHRAAPQWCNARTRPAAIARQSRETMPSPALRTPVHGLVRNCDRALGFSFLFLGRERASAGCRKRRHLDNRLLTTRINSSPGEACNASRPRL